MGNSQSQSSHHRRSVVKTKSVASRLTRKLSCISASWSLDHSSSFASTSQTDEKTFLNDSGIPAASDCSTIEEKSEQQVAYSDFLDSYPEYQHTWIIDSLRRSEFTRLTHSGETYVDYMGGSLYPENLVKAHSEFLMRSVMGNTHSVSNSSQLSSSCAAEARAAVLKFFQAPPGYTVIFASNATAAMKLVGESYPFRAGGAFVLGVDSHNSVNGIRRFASQGGARICYLASSQHGGINVSDAEAVLTENKPDCLGWSPCLFALTGQSNISNSKNPLSIARYAQALGYHTLLDAAALAPSTPISLRDTPVDAMAVSFYKMFGFPTGVGALIVKESFLRELNRPWFAGGTVDVVQVPGSLVTLTHDIREQFEDGTINYLVLPAITQGLRFLATYIPFLPIRLSSLLHYLTSHLSQLRHDTTGAPVVRILSRLPTGRIKDFGEQLETGSTVSLIFLGPDGKMIPNSFIEYTASRQKISLRTGCVCNPGGAAAILGIEEDMNLLEPGVTLKDFERSVGRELGVVRISLGLISSFDDVWRVIQFSAGMGSEKILRDWLADWDQSRRE